MKSSDFVCFHELDFVLPVHRFHVNFSYTDAQRLSFIREFFLRVINVSPQQPKDLAQFFALTKRELSEALSDLVTSGDLHYRDDGYIELTKQSKAYFSGLASVPKVQKIDESHGHFNFELSDMNYLGHEKINENWKFALRLSIDNEIKSRSELQAKKAFQFNFQDIIDKGGIKGVSENDDKSINLYNVSDVRKVTEQPLRINHQFTISKDGNHLERGDIEALKDSSNATELVTQAIEKLRQSQNFLEIFRVVDQFQDDRCKSYITDDGLDISRILSDQQHYESKGDKTIPLLGIIYTPKNWLKVAEILEKNLKQASKKTTNESADLIWLAPSNPYWGKSEKLFSCLKNIQDKSSTTGKKGKKLYQPQFYLPIDGDDSGRSRRNWTREFQGISEKALSGYTGDFCSGNVEVIVHRDLFAVVSYHLTAPELSPVPVPFGFITQDKNQIVHIHSQVIDFLSETDSETRNSRNIGLLKTK